MKYYTWKLKWSNGEGTDPTDIVNNDVVEISPQFSTGDWKDSSTLIYCYLLKGELNLAELTDWSVTETTAEAMFNAAKVLDAGATWVGDRVVFSRPPDPLS